MHRYLRRNVLLETGIAMCSFLFFVVVYIKADVWVIEAIPSTIIQSFFPSIVALLMSGISFLLVIFSVRSAWHIINGNVNHEQELIEKCVGKSRFFALYSYIGSLFLYFISMHYIGFLYSTPFIMMIVAKLLGLRGWLVPFFFFVAFALIIDFFVLNYMKIFLPVGVLFEH